MFTASVTQAIGLIRKMFRLDRRHVIAEHVASFIARIINGWQLIVLEVNMQTKSSLATHFAKAL